MSTMRQIRHAVEVLGSENIILCHATSTYPAPASELNLRMIHTLQAEFPNVPVGYSGHETGLQTTVAAVALGAVFVERHITLDRADVGLGPGGVGRAAGPATAGPRHPGDLEALGDGVKQVYPGELAAMKKLRRVPGELPTIRPSWSPCRDLYARRRPGPGGKSRPAAERSRGWLTASRSEGRRQIAVLAPTAGPTRTQLRAMAWLAREDGHEVFWYEPRLCGLGVARSVRALPADSAGSTGWWSVTRSPGVIQ